MKHILFFGDSLTAGYGLKQPELDSFPALLSKIAEQENLAFSYTNAGISGDTSYSALLRLPTLQQAHIDIFVIGIGANDMRRGYSPQSLTYNIELIINKIKISHPQAKILLLGMELPQWITHDSVILYRDIYTKIAKKFELTLVPFLLEGVIGNPTLNLRDLAHPNEKGYQLIAGRLWLPLESMLKSE
jgi:acyl-CoA thioesterase-1